MGLHKGGLYTGERRGLYSEIYGMYGFHDFRCMVFPCSSQINKKITHYIIDVDKIYLF
jgi:hypothetical protein